MTDPMMSEPYSSVLWRLVVEDARIVLTCLGYVLPALVIGWLISRLKFQTKSLASELGREEETKRWDRERRRRYGRHQHRHGHHHRYPVSVAA